MPGTPDEDAGQELPNDVESSGRGKRESCVRRDVACPLPTIGTPGARNRGGGEHSARAGKRKRVSAIGMTSGERAHKRMPYPGPSPRLPGGKIPGVLAQNERTAITDRLADDIVRKIARITFAEGAPSLA